MAGAIGAFAMGYKLFFGALASARNGLGEDQGKKQRSQSMAKEPATATSRKGMAALERPITNRRVVTTDANPTNPEDCRVAALAAGGRRRLGLPLGWSTGKPKGGTAGWVAQRGYASGAWGTESRMPVVRFARGNAPSLLASSKDNARLLGQETVRRRWPPPVRCLTPMVGGAAAPR